MSARLKRAARDRHSRRDVAENSTFIHKTGRPRACTISLSMTHAGYQVSDFEIMSLVPRATTMAVVSLVNFFLSIAAPAEAVRPTRASIDNRGHVVIALTRVGNDPNAFAPTVSESPIKRSVPCPFAAIRAGCAESGLTGVKGRDVETMVATTKISRTKARDG